jgi:RNA polymerase sigma-70 factor (ECF subfamily)
VSGSITIHPASRLSREGPIASSLAAARSGDPHAFGALYDAHAGRVHAICLRLCGDSVRAAELVQDVFVKVWEGLPGFREDSAFTTWLHRIAVNVVLQARRGEHRRLGRVALVEDHPTAAAQAATPPVDGALSIDLENAVAALPELLRTVFVLHDVEGYRHEEIAALLEIPIGTCRSHLFRARRLLREELS